VVRDTRMGFDDCVIYPSPKPVLLILIIIVIVTVTVTVNIDRITGWVWMS
jgi:hypothetical protein